MTRPWPSPPPAPARSRTLAGDLDPRRNGLNALRLLLAGSVLLYHCWPLGGFGGSELLDRTLGDVGVDAFFVLSGFLITRSWRQDPRLGRYAWHRFLRIMPAYWVCLVLTAFVAAPLAWRHQHVAGSALPGPALSYVSHNSLLLQRQLTIGGTPVRTPFTDSWNGSLYTLFYEALCYVGIGVLGVLGALRTRLTLPVLFLAAWAGYLVAGAVGLDEGGAPHLLVRFAMTFLAGAAVLDLSDRLPSSGLLAAACLAVVGGAMALLPDYKALAVVPFAYGVLWCGMRLPVVVPGRWDISYGVYIYGFLVQQLLATYGWQRHGLAAFLGASLVGTVVLAALSCRLVEQPALRAKRWTPGGRTTATTGVPRVAG